jgi:glc operon protein GlcG
MTRKILAVMALLLVAGFASLQLSAQGGPPQGQPGGGAPPPPPQTIDLATAKKMIAASEAAATAMNAHVAICVLDSNGDVVLYERMDTAAPRAVTSSQGKARAALLFGIPTTQVADAMRGGKPLSTILTPPLGGNWEITIQQGGLPIMKNGKLIGAIGAGGSASANDEKFAQAGIDAMGK